MRSWGRRVRSKVIVHVQADLVGDDCIFSRDTRVSSGTRVKHNFRQSDFFAEPYSPDRLRKQCATHVPQLTENGEIDRFILQLMNGTNAIEDIAREAQRQFPARFPTLPRAIGHATKLSRNYSL